MGLGCQGYTFCFWVWGGVRQSLQIKHVAFETSGGHGETKIPRCGGVHHENRLLSFTELALGLAQVSLAG